MTFDSYITFLIASVILTFMPGPTVLLVIHYSLQHKSWVGKFTVPAVILGDIIAISSAFTGIGALLKIYPESFALLRILGGIYLIILGISSILSKSNFKQKNILPTKLLGRRIFMHVFFVTAFNPKTIIFFLVFFIQFINPVSNTFNQLLTMGISYVIIGAVCTIIYNYAADQMSIWIKSPLIREKIHIISGMLLCCLGITTIIF